MFSGCLAHEAAELLTVAAFTGPSSLPQPGACLFLYLSMLFILARSHRTEGRSAMMSSRKSSSTELIEGAMLS